MNTLNVLNHSSDFDGFGTVFFELNSSNLSGAQWKLNGQLEIF